jgi:nucleoid-associated protein YgaU
MSYATGRGTGLATSYPDDCARQDAAAAAYGAAASIPLPALQAQCALYIGPSAYSCDREALARKAPAIVAAVAIRNGCPPPAVVPCTPCQISPPRAPALAPQRPELPASPRPGGPAEARPAPTSRQPTPLPTGSSSTSRLPTGSSSTSRLPTGSSSTSRLPNGYTSPDPSDPTGYPGTTPDPYTRQPVPTMTVSADLTRYASPDMSASANLYRNHDGSMTYDAAATYDSGTSPSPSLMRLFGLRAEQNLPSSPDPFAPAPVGNPGPSDFRPGNWNFETCTYTIASGDTLTGLARTYLGAPERWREIWDMQPQEWRFSHSPDGICTPEKRAAGCKDIVANVDTLLMPREACDRAKAMLQDPNSPKAPSTTGKRAPVPVPGEDPHAPIVPGGQAAATSSTTKTVLVVGGIAALLGAGYLAFR